MKADVEELLRDGMERFTANVQAPAGLARAAGRLHRRRQAARAALACGTAAAVAATVAVIAVTARAGGTAARTGADEAGARLTAYVTSRVQSALASENLVFVGRTESAGELSVTWAYRHRSRFEEYWPATDHRDRIVNGQRLWDFPPSLRGKPAQAQGTALVGGRLTFAYVTYFDHRYSLSALRPAPGNPCSVTGLLAMGAPPAPSADATDWPSLIAATLACRAATVTGHVKINGVETTRITGKPVTVKLSAGYARAIRARWVTARWTLYVNPATYLPVRMTASTEAFGGPGGRTLYTSATDVRWLRPTPANVAQALVTIPPGFHRFSGPAANQ
jgi:hypothetical protein